MHHANLAGICILFVTAICDRSSAKFGGRGSYHVPARNCDTENKNALDEIKSEIQSLQHLVVGLRQKLDPDFKLPLQCSAHCTGGCEKEGGGKCDGSCEEGYVYDNVQKVCVDNPCNSNPCKYGGTCNVVEISYACTCKQGITGRNCDTQVDPCESNPCQNDGTCRRYGNTYTCTCSRGFEGTRCETPKLIPFQAESKCPQGFEYVERSLSCYKVVREHLSWIAASQKCQELHPEAHLAAITKSEENMGLTAYLDSEIANNAEYRRINRFRPFSENAMYWTSGQRLDETSCTDEFVWKMANSTQLPLSFTFWELGEPNCHNNHDNQPESCLQIRSQGSSYQWNDVPCDGGYYPLCECDPL